MARAAKVAKGVRAGELVGWVGSVGSVADWAAVVVRMVVEGKAMAVGWTTAERAKVEATA